MVQYFNWLGVSQPELVDELVDVAHNQTKMRADSEVQLDIEVVATVAPGVQIATYFVLNTDDGFLHAINKAIHDQINQPSILSISWVLAENLWTDQINECTRELS
ncbi:MULTISPECIES: hypothetical protein [Bacillus]|uniref:hypothetical protein n=1 Tax=Bacillus TaxID=1386 RepID=UPI00032EAC15|nr:MULTISPECIES: hypothetical protein [Bacillus cereus group]EOP20017.1 hypothetical protein IIS_05953 [Bacillus cereus VD131]MBJ8044120.1 hypothetical protein [Bacillus cereus group sp. N17]PEI92293.1 hypothetical protein CN671_31320 [Bacillus toyonensis]PFZ67158.1 hypothetical protein COL72_29085 [Bacillus toyonensis]TBX54468.1 hypothetical protein E0M28_30385 [Bacillus toyonensis]